MSIDQTNARDLAITHLKARRDFGMHAVTYVVFNSAMVLIWYLTGHGYFWPIWLIGLWGIGLVLHAWDVWMRRPISEDDIQREMDRHSRSHA